MAVVPSRDLTELMQALLGPLNKKPPPPPQPAMGFFTDTSLCIGCKACEVACKQWNQLPAKEPVWTGSSYDNTGELSAITWRHVQFIDRPVLKAPVWHWEIIWYFFFGGLAAGCYIIATIASLFGSREDRAVVRTGYYLSLLALLPCPPLLIKDLGRPERFLNMLRMFKVKSPMSMGTWSLVTFSLSSSTTALIQAARDGLLGRWWGARFLVALPQKLIALPGAAAGFFLGSYTGVLLTATSVPLRSRSKLLGGIFLTSALSTSSALLSFVLRLTNAPRSALHKLERLEWAALLIEMTGILAFLRGTGRASRTLVGTAPSEHGMTFWRFVCGSGLALPWLLQTLSLIKRSPQRRASSGLFISLLVLVGGYFLRRTMIEAGHTSSADARTTLWNAKR